MSIHENPFWGSWAETCRHEKANRHFLQVCKDGCKHMYNNYEPLPTMRTTSNPVFFTLKVTDCLPVIYLS